ncbi:MAG: hypothetical protein WB792_00755 [Desulfobacterales bacterium]
MSTLAAIAKIIAPLAAAILVGNWFMSEVKKVRIKGGPWYQPYLSIPGIMIILAVLLPVIFWMLKR